MNRRNVAVGLAVALAGSSFAAAAAEPWPTKPVRFIVPFPAGSAPDVLIRLLGGKLSERWGQGVIVENKPGASGVIGMTTLLASPVDAHTFGFVQGSAISVAPRTIKNASYDYMRDFVSVTLVAVAPLLLAVPQDSPFLTLEDLVKAAKAKPESVEVGDPGRATLPHLAAALLGAQTGARFLHVHYQGGAQAMQAMMGKQVKAQVETYNVLAGMVDAKQVRILASFGERAEPGLENFPLASKAFPGVVGNGWFAVIARKGTPADVVARLNQDLGVLLQQAEVRTRFRELGAYPRPGSPMQLDAFIAEDLKQWQAVIDKFDIKAE